MRDGVLKPVRIKSYKLRWYSAFVNDFFIFNSEILCAFIDTSLLLVISLSIEEIKTYQSKISIT